MTILGVSGSPRRLGNAELLLDKALEGAASKGAAIEKIILSELDFEGCRDCGGCVENGVCVLEDDMRSVYEKIEKCSCIIVASPVFFGNVSSQLKAMIDRFQSIWNRSYLLKKKRSCAKKTGAFLCVSASNEEKFFENSKKTIKAFFNTIDAEYAAELYCGGVDEKGAILKKTDILGKAFLLGAELVSR